MLGLLEGGETVQLGVHIVHLHVTPDLLDLLHGHMGTKTALSKQSWQCKACDLLDLALACMHPMPLSHEDKMHF